MGAHHGPRCRARAPFSATPPCETPSPAAPPRIPDDYASNSKDSLAVLDLGCGNLRFERFPRRTRKRPPCASPPSTTAPIWHLPKSALYLPPSRTAFAAPLLLPKRKRRMLQGRARIPPKRSIVDLRALDIVESLLDGTFADRLPRNSHDLAVAFGLMHHLPTFALRARVLEGLLGSLRPGGFCRRVVLAVPERPAPGCQSRHGHRRGPRRPSPPPPSTKTTFSSAGSMRKAPTASATTRPRTKSTPFSPPSANPARPPLAAARLPLPSPSARLPASPPTANSATSTATSFCSASSLDAPSPPPFSSRKFTVLP